MYLIHVLLPLNDNEGCPHGRELLRAVADELTEKFGGLTAHKRRELLAEEIRAVLRLGVTEREIQAAAERLLDLAA